MKGLILCNGRPPEPDIFRKYLDVAEYFIAADGGGNIARKLGHLPRVVIGDLDSFERNGDDPFEIIEDPDQERNDLEKALSFARDEGIVEIAILGATGHRLDHTLKNLSVLKQFNDRFEQLFFADNYGETSLIPENYRAELPPGTTVSLFPLSGRVEGIRTSGLKYPLKDEHLENGIRDGSSNVVTSSPMEILHRSGDLLLFTAHYDR